MIHVLAMNQKQCKRLKCSKPSILSAASFTRSGRHSTKCLL